MTRRELAKPSPRNRLIPVVKVISAIFYLSNGKSEIPEICDAMIQCYDGGSMMLYHGMGYGLAEPFDGDNFDDHSGINERTAIISEIFNSRFWEKPDASIYSRRERSSIEHHLISKSDSIRLARRIWDTIFTFDNDGAEPFPGEAYLECCNDPEFTGDSIKSGMQKKAEPPTKTIPDVSLTKESRRWPWGPHHTAALGHLEAAAHRFWVNYDPSDATTAPTNAVVSEWLQNERKVSRTMADAIASMLRVDGLPTGPRS